MNAPWQHTPACHQAQNSPSIARADKTCPRHRNHRKHTIHQCTNNSSMTAPFEHHRPRLQLRPRVKIGRLPKYCTCHFLPKISWWWLIFRRFRSGRDRFLIRQNPCCREWKNGVSAQCTGTNYYNLVTMRLSQFLFICVAPWMFMCCHISLWS